MTLAVLDPLNSESDTQTSKSFYLCAEDKNQIKRDFEGPKNGQRIASLQNETKEIRHPWTSEKTFVELLLEGTV